MFEALGIEHLTDLTTGEAVLAFFTPLIIFAAFFVAQLVLPARKVPGYVKDPETGEPRNYRLNGLLVFVIAELVWAFELFGLPPRLVLPVDAVGGPRGHGLLRDLRGCGRCSASPRARSRTRGWRCGRAGPRRSSSSATASTSRCGGTWSAGRCLSLNAQSAAAWNHGQFGDDANPGLYLYAAFWTFYIFDYFIWERVQLYTYDLIHEHIGFKLWWGGLVAYGWLFILPLWGIAAHPTPASPRAGRTSG